MNLASTSQIDDSDEREFTFVDFLPHCIEQAGVFKRPKYSDFRSLIDKANEWLRSYPKYEIIKCETLKFKIEAFNKVDYQNVLYIDRGELDNYYLKGLRIWIINTFNEKKQYEQIGYFDIIPAQIKEGTMLTSPEFETLDEMIKNRNDVLRNQPFPGNILTIETQEVIMEHGYPLLPDETYYRVGHVGRNVFVFILRIFYKISEPRFEEIGVIDFIPNLLQVTGILATPKFETFSALVHKASNWCAEQKDIKICNVQSLEIKLRRGNCVNTQRMKTSKPASIIFYHVRVLRVAYVKFPVKDGAVINLNSIRQLTCKNFIPAQLTTGIQSFESLTEAKKRISSWMKATGAEVLSAETVAIPTYGNVDSNVESNLIYIAGERNQFYVLITRVYLKESYSDPPMHMLPPIPEVKTSCSIL